MGNLEIMTDRQREDWPRAVAEINRYHVGASDNPDHYDWTFDWQEETRPGRGQSFSALFIDGEHYAQIMMDVYGYPIVSVAALDILHSSSDEECPCEFCTAERDEEDAEFEAAQVAQIRAQTEWVKTLKPVDPKEDQMFNSRPVRANFAIPPGEWLKEWMEENGKTIQEVAFALSYEKRWVKQILKGQVRLSVVIADDLEKLTGIASPVWLIFERKYREDKERLKKTFWKRVLASFLRH